MALGRKMGVKTLSRKERSFMTPPRAPEEELVCRGEIGKERARMVRRSKRSSLPLPRRFAKWLLGLNLGVALLLGGWYVTQPETRQREVRRLVENAFERDKRVSVLDIAWDVWQLYYSESATGRIAAGDKTIVYGGVPRVAGGGASAMATAEFRVLTNRGYVAGYSDALGNPLWVAYRVEDLAKLPRPAPRPEKFEVDRRTAARVAPEAYAGSGYDRGHLAPNYAIATRFGAAAQRETFLMSNITPQRHALNAGLWRELEMKIATSYPARYGEVWVLTGPIFGAQPRTLRGGVAVPDAFFLIVVDENEGKLRTLAFVVPQDAPAGDDPRQYLTSIEEIQRRTGLDVLSELDDASEKQIELHRATRVW
jgi:endonuclease G